MRFNLKASIDLLTGLEAILTGSQTGEKLKCLYENLMSNNFRKTAVKHRYGSQNLLVDCGILWRVALVCNSYFLQRRRFTKIIPHKILIQTLLNADKVFSLNPQCSV